MKAALFLGLACLAGRALLADALPAPEPSPVDNLAPDNHAADVSPEPTMQPYGQPDRPAYPSLDPGRAVPVTPGAEAAPMPALAPVPTLPPAVQPSHVWEALPEHVLGISSHGSVVGLSVERTLGAWFSVVGFLGLHSDSRYNAAEEGGSLRVYPRGHAPRGAYVEAQEYLVQENAAAPSAGVYQAQRLGLALGWQWLLGGQISVSLAGVLYQEDAVYSSYAYPAIGSNHDVPPGQVQVAVDLSLGWDL